MDNVNTPDGFLTADVIFGILYATGAILLLVTSYVLYIKRFKRNKLKAVSEVVLTTSRYDVYAAKTQFLIELSNTVNVALNIANEDQTKTEVLFDGEMVKGENVIDFDPSEMEDGIYYLSLKTEDTSILRKIKIAKN